MTDTDFEAIYACKAHAGFSMRVGEKRYRFEKHQLVVTNEAEAEALDDFLIEYPKIGNKVKKVDLAAAEALVKEHKATHGGAHSGLFSSAAMAQLEPNKLGQRDASLEAMGAESKASLVDALSADSALIVTEKQDVPKVAAKPAINILNSKTA